MSVILKAPAVDLRQSRWNVRLLHEAVVQDEPVEAVPKIDEAAPLLLIYVRNVFDEHGEQQHTLVQHSVVLEVVEQGIRHPVRGMWS